MDWQFKGRRKEISVAAEPTRECRIIGGRYIERKRINEWDFENGKMKTAILQVLTFMPNVCNKERRRILGKKY